LIASSSTDVPASASAAMSSPCCASPLGAVRLALHPSWRTAAPDKLGIEPSSPQCAVIDPHASPRA
jgi:hypothetical protein